MWFHIFNRGVDRQDLFHDDCDYRAFEELVADAVDRFGIEVHGLTLMTNHFHALVHCTDDRVSESMQRIQAIYAGRYNHRYQRTGSLFESRFKSRPIATDEHLLTVSRYVHRNPVAIVGERALAAYRWSSYGPYIGRRSTPGWLSTAMVLDQFGGDANRYQRFVEDEPSTAVPSRTVPLSIHHVEGAVAQAAGVDVATLHVSRRRTPNDPRLAAIWLIHDRRLASAAEIAERFGLGSPSSARAAAQRARALRVTDDRFRRLCDRATAALQDRSR